MSIASLRDSLRRLTYLATLLAVFCTATSGQPLDRPNILWVTSEDMSPNLGSFGDVYAVTPNLDRLADRGVRYRNAFAPIGVCAPARSSLILGMYAPSVGSHHMQSWARLPDSIRLYSQHLRQAGYYCTNNWKQHYNLETVPEDAWDESSRQAHWRNRRPGQPFFAIFNLNFSHESQIRLSEEAYRQRVQGFQPHELHDPALADVPPYHPDTPEVRRDWARYADMITYMDKRVGEILQELEADGLAEDTIVFYYSDHGAGMPRSKRWLYDSSLRVPLIIHFPPKYQHLSESQPGGLTDRLVSFVDFGPTLLSLAGVEIPDRMQGSAFLGSRTAEPRRYIHGFRDRMDERYDMVRAVRDQRYKYIRNYMPHRIYAQHLNYMYEMPTMQVWQRLYDQGKLIGPQKFFFQPKAAEELYDTWADPHEVNNLAGQAEFQAIQARLSAELRRWILEIRDLGFLPEAEMERRSAGTTPYEHAQDLREYELVRILEAAELASRRQPSDLPRLVRLLKDDDSAVRYWGATGLAGLGAEAAPAATELLSALKDEAPDVRITAAEALCNFGQYERALPTLAAALQHESEWVRLRAAGVLSDLGGESRTLLPEIKQAFEDNERRRPSNYPNRILGRLLQILGG